MREDDGFKGKTYVRLRERERGAVGVTGRER